MGEVTVRRLAYRGDPALRTLVDAAVGDALRTEVPDDGRLVLVRRLHVGNVAQAGRGLANRTALSWRELAGGARHGADGGASDAACVWFASAAEAHAVLLGELACGRSPNGWFWALAVPGWRGQPLAKWLAERLDAALRDDDGAAIAALLDECLEAGCAEQAARALAAMMGPPPPDEVEARVVELSRAREVPLPQTIRDADRSDDEPPIDLMHRLALRTVRRLPPGFAAALRRTVPDQRAQRLVRTLATALVRKDHPALALRREALEALAGHIATVLTRGAEALELPRRHPVVASQIQEARKAASIGNARNAARSKPQPSERERRASLKTEAKLPEPIPPPPDQVEFEPDIERPSAHAGLFLAVTPLIALGWREWLVARPGFLPYQPGSSLLRYFARRHRAPPADPFWQVFPQPEDLAPAELDQALELWRKGLDGWLRRTAGRRLADLVGRSGWLLDTGDGLVVRFRLNAIDLNLRRLALDRDPGWVDWLGRSVRLVFRDAPQFGGLRP